MPGTPTAPRTPELQPPLAAALRDGTPIRLRAIQPEDRALLTEGMEHLSLRSRCRRLFSPIRTPSEQLVAHRNGVGRLHAEVLAENGPMIAVPRAPAP